jgi:pyruvate/2-oxoglutarate dehydrogenase complex dihydrolipoamide dehydrogenase (E3) component
MKEFENIIIGFGKGGKTIAGALAAKGESTAIIEKSNKMYGGTCINVACIPTKSLEHSARLSFAQGGDFTAKAERYRNAVEEKRRLTTMLRGKNYDKAVAAGALVIDGEASFTGKNTIEVKSADGSVEAYKAKRIFINTGSVPFIPPIEGLTKSKHVFMSETMMENEVLPKELVIIGGGYIGLEFASYYTNFGSHVTIIQDGDAFIPREDSEVADAVFANLTSRGITIIKNAQVKSVHDEDDNAVVTVAVVDAESKAHGTANYNTQILKADAVLVATGRRPNIASLNLSAGGIEVTERGAITVDEKLRTTADNVWAMGDVAGGLQFTYISLDDSRIVKSQLVGDGSRTTQNRGTVPYSVFIDPPLSRAGLTEAEARAKGYDVKVAKLPAAAIPKAQVLQKPAGLLKAVIDAKTNEILGAHLFCADSHEMINVVKIAMDAHVPYTVLRDSIFTHPTMSESLNDLFSAVK